MKKNKNIYKVYAYIFLIIFLIFFTTFGIYKIVKLNNKKDEQISEKVSAEIKYLDSNFLKLFNQMNNIEFENYKISINEINKEFSEDKKNSEDNGNLKFNGEEGENNNSKTKSGEEDTKSQEEKIKIFDLKRTNILTANEDVDWNKVKYEVENMYLSIPTITLDLYQTQINKQDILNFNSEYDNLTKFTQEKNKKEVLNQLVKLYESLIKFSDNILTEEPEKIIIKTKLNIFKAYSKLDDKKWNEISKDVNLAIEEFSKIMSKKEIKKQKIYGINKTYIMLNELQKSLEKENIEIFLIKYKNIVEELNKM